MFILSTSADTYCIIAVTTRYTRYNISNRVYLYILHYGMDIETVNRGDSSLACSASGNLRMDDLAAYILCTGYMDGNPHIYMQSAKK